MTDLTESKYAWFVSKFRELEIIASRIVKKMAETGVIHSSAEPLEFRFTDERVEVQYALKSSATPLMETTFPAFWLWLENVEEKIQAHANHMQLATFISHCQYMAKYGNANSDMRHFEVCLKEALAWMSILTRPQD